MLYYPNWLTKSDDGTSNTEEVGGLSTISAPWTDGMSSTFALNHIEYQLCHARFGGRIPDEV